MNKRIRMLKENNDDEYEHLIAKHIREYREVIQKETESTLFQLGIPEQDYNNSFEELSKKLSTAKLIANMELEVREKHESVLPLKSRQEVKKIYCEQLKMEADSDLYLQQLLLSTDNTTEVLGFMITMKIRQEDIIFINHGFKAIDIKRQVQNYDLINNPEVW